jgi:hypothetical protein
MLGASCTGARSRPSRRVEDGIVTRPRMRLAAQRAHNRMRCNVRQLIERFLVGIDAHWDELLRSRAADHDGTHCDLHVASHCRDNMVDADNLKGFAQIARQIVSNAGCAPFRLLQRTTGTKKGTRRWRGQPLQIGDAP